jgi:replicative DNA helicase
VRLVVKSSENFKIPPFDLDAEKTILGIIIIDNSKLHTVLENIEINDFYDRGNQIIFESMIELMDSNTPVDFVTLRDTLYKSGKLDDIGGLQYLVKIADDITSTANVEYHTNIIKEKSNLRKLISIGNKLISMGYEGKESTDEIIEDVENAIFSVLGKNIGMGIGQVRDYLASTIELIEKRCHEQGTLTGISTSFVELDSITDGLQRADLIILACRPSVGKTSLSLNIMQNASIRHNIPTLFFSLEMAKEQLIMRILSSLGKVNSQKLKKGNLRDADWKKILKCKKQLESAPIFIDDSHGLSASALKAKCRRYKQELGIELVIIDYLQLLFADGKFDNRQYEITAITRSLKDLAKELNIPILVCSQLSRAVEKREVKRPQLSDLRDSGAIEQDADLVLMLHRPNMYTALAEDDFSEMQDDGTVELIVGKNRNGPTGILNLVFLKEYTLFHDVSDAQPISFPEE